MFLARRLQSFLVSFQAGGNVAGGTSGSCCASTSSTLNSASEADDNESNNSSASSMDLNYEDIVEAQKEGNVVIIDVRNDDEIQETGKLPGSIHIPMNEVPSALSLSDHEFEKKYRKKLPDCDDKIIVSCRSGKRSAMVQCKMQSMGYNNVYNYAGGWLDWESRQSS